MLSRLTDVRAAIQAAARESGRTPDAVTLTGVSKTQPVDAILALRAAGQSVFGENRVQEAEAKFAALKADDPALRLHLIGPLQTNKVRKAAALFDVIETLDRPALATDLAKLPRCPELFVQVNTGEEMQKAGIAPRDLAGFLDYCCTLGLPVTGLMCIPPVDEHPALHFAFLAELAERHGLAKLSMGMSSDFVTAIRFGATHVRVGTALFGARYAGSTARNDRDMVGGVSGTSASS